MNELLSIFHEKPEPNLYYISELIPLQELTKLCEESQFNLAYLDGTKIHNKQELLINLALVLNFPDYFGYNWDAFEDCLTDLSPSSECPYLLFYSHPEFLIENDPNSWQTLLAILASSIEFLDRQSISFYVIINSEEKDN